MTDTEVITWLPIKTPDNWNERNEGNLFEFNNECEWDKYYGFKFCDEFEDYDSFKDEKKSKSEELSEIEENGTDERSILTIVTSEESVSEILEKSEESSIHFCFREIEISDSQLKIRNIFNLYPIPDDPGITPAFWIIFPKRKVDKKISYQKFIDVAEFMNLRPINCLKYMLKKNECNLRYYGLDPRIFRAISEVLFDNNIVNILDLKDNWLTMDACFHLNELLLQNTFLETLNLSGCRIGADGAKRLEEGLASAPNLHNLNLSHCELGDEGIHQIYSAIYLSEALQILNLTDNHLCEKCAKDLEAIILKSQTLTHLNLSWNSLCNKETCKIIFNALIDNQTIKEIDLSWNSVGSESIFHICSFLSKSTNLEILNLSANRFVDRDAQQIAKVLSKNFVLEIFYLGNNPIKDIGAFELIQGLTFEKAPKSNIHLFDLENIWVRKNALPILEVIKQTKPWLNIKLGGILGNFKLIGPNEKQIYLKRANFEAMNAKKKKERKDFGHFVLSLEDNTVPIKKFAELVKNFKLKLSTSLVLAIGKAFTVEKSLVDLSDLKSFYMKEYPGTVLPPMKEKKAKKEKKNKKDKSEKKDKKEEPLKAKVKEVKFKEKKIKPKTELKEIPEFEIPSQEYEFENKNILFEDSATDFDF